MKTRTGLFLILQLAAAGAFVGCGGDSGDGGDKGGGGDDDESGDSTGASGDPLRVVFDPMYSAFIPNHDCQVPVAVADLPGSEVDFTASDDSIVDITPTEDGAMIRTLKAGSVTIRARSKDGTRAGNATLTIESYTEAEWEAGEMRYNNGMRIPIPEGGVPRTADGGTSTLGAGGIPMLMFNENLACASCHSETSQIGDFLGADVQHTPQQTGGYSPDELIKIFTMGMKPANVGYHSGIPGIDIIWPSIHQWNVTEEEKRGIIAYVRSLQPKSQGEIDFGGLISRFRGDGGFRFGDGGFSIPRRDAGASGSDAGASGSNEMDAGM